jgi:hypothetical protein
MGVSGAKDARFAHTQVLPVCGLKLLMYEAIAPSVLGLKLVVYAVLSF